MAAERRCLDHALAYAARGWPVLPLHTPDERGICSCRRGRECTSPGKHPRTQQGVKDASTDPATIERWWGQFPAANVGIATGRESGLVVLDVDPGHGGFGLGADALQRRSIAEPRSDMQHLEATIERVHAQLNVVRTRTQVVLTKLVERHAGYDA